MLTLSVTANGPGKDQFTYQWKKRGSNPIHGTTSNRNFKIASVSVTDSGSYYCVVKNQWGNTVESDSAIVNVLSMLLPVTI